jgi:hypothetical protein
LEKEENRKASAEDHPQVALAELGHLALGADDVAQDEARASEPHDAEERRPERDHDHRLPRDVPRGVAITAPVVLRDERRGRRGDAVAHDGADGRDLIADADGPEARTGDVRAEPRNEVGIDQVERRLKSHAERERRAEPEERYGERPVHDALAGRARRHDERVRSIASPARSKQVSGICFFRRTSAVAATNRSVTGSW